MTSISSLQTGILTPSHESKTPATNPSLSSTTQAQASQEFESSEQWQTLQALIQSNDFKQPPVHAEKIKQLKAAYEAGQLDILSKSHQNKLDAAKSVADRLKAFEQQFNMVT